MAIVAYTLCTITALSCAYLLMKAYWASASRLIMWCGLCFCGLTISNALILVDLLLITNGDLYDLRIATTLLSVSLLVFGLVWESRA